MQETQITKYGCDHVIMWVRQVMWASDVGEPTDREDRLHAMWMVM